MPIPGPHDPAEMLFEPTGDLAKDYSAYCEIDDKPERDDLLEGIQMDEQHEGAVSRIITNVRIRNLEYCLNKRDAQPLTNAIPHCNNLLRVHLTGCGVTEHSYKLFVEALYRSPTVASFAVDFNPGELFRDPTVSKKDKNEVLVFPAQYRGAHLKKAEPEIKEEKRGKESKKAKDAAKDDKPKDDLQDKPPIPVPSGWHAALLAGIQQLSLRGNDITDKQLELFLPLLEQHNELLSLSLWGNSITSDGVCMLAASLKKNRKLTALNLGHNKFDDRGVKALAECFYTVDVTNEEALRLRQRIIPGTELPPYPTYTELVMQANQASTEEKKDTKKSAGKGKKNEGPVERPKVDFDRDCVRLDEGHIRVPGNFTLWSLNISHCQEITGNGVQALIEMLHSHEPNYIQSAPVTPDFVFPVPSPYAASIALEHISVEHPKLENDIKEALQKALEESVEQRKKLTSRNP